MNQAKFNKVSKDVMRLFDKANEISNGKLKRIIIEQMDDGGIETEFRTMLFRKSQKKARHNGKN